MASFGGSIKLTGADEYKSALKQITQSLRETGSELTAVASRYDKNDSSLSTLKAKTTEMTGVLAKQNQAYQQLKSAYDSFSAKVSQQAQAHDKLVQEYEKEKQELENIRKASGESSQAFQDQQAKVNSLATAVAKSSQNMSENEIALSKMKTQLNQTEATVNKTTKEIDELGNETEESGEKAKKSSDGYSVFKNILANLGTQAINSCINGLKNLGSAFVDVGKQALNSYASYEQLAGGVETLFGAGGKTLEEYANSVGKTVDEAKGEYDRLLQAQQNVMDNSAEAYKTAGMSANEYMETVTSFSASLVQSLGGDTLKASEYSNRAIIDMSDNANKMGTSMEMIQNAYQGFAKQNYTMLDNLKLGYGGTKGEMERLIADANKVKEANGEMANLSIDSFADVTEAIHIIQTEMGITGTTSKEASNTIEGSVKSMKSAYQNFLTGLANGNADMGKLVQNLVDSVITAGGQILPAIDQIAQSIIDVLPQILNSIIEALPQFLEAGTNILNTLITGIQTNLPAIMQAVMTIVTTIVNTLLQNLPQILQMGIQIIVSLIQGIAQQLPTLIPQMVETVITMVETLLDNIDLIIDAGIELIIGLAEGLIEALPQLIDKIPIIIDKLITAIVNNLPKLIEMGITLIVKLAEGLIKAIPQLVSKIPQIISSLVNGIASYYSKLFSIGGDLLNKVKDGIVSGIGKLADVGKNLVQGLWNGINNAKDWILNKIKGFGKAVLNGIKSFFGIHSPSTVFKDQVGKNLALGLGEGFEDEMKEVTNEMQNAIPTSFDTDVNVGSNNIASGSSNYYSMVDAFKEALSEMKIELDDEVAGRFVETTVTNAIYN